LLHGCMGLIDLSRICNMPDPFAGARS